MRGWDYRKRGRGKEDQKGEERKMGGRCKLQRKKTKRKKEVILINVILEGKHGKFKEILNISIRYSIVWEYELYL